MLGRGWVWGAGGALPPKCSPPVPWQREQSRAGGPGPAGDQPGGHGSHARPPQHRQPPLGMGQSFSAAPKSGADAPSKPPERSSSQTAFLPDILSEVHLIRADLEHGQQTPRKRGESL